MNVILKNGTGKLYWHANVKDLHAICMLTTPAKA